jgi:hypothetical protein
VLFIYITRLVSNEIFSPSNKIHREVGWAKDLSAPLCMSIGVRNTIVQTGTEITRPRSKKIFKYVDEDS